VESQGIDSSVEVHGGPPDVQEFATPCTGIGGETIEGAVLAIFTDHCPKSKYRSFKCPR
jgi:hypothetical protein